MNPAELPVPGMSSSVRAADREPVSPLGTAAPTPSRERPLFASEQLMQGHRAIDIRHNGTLYRLQATRQGKLILTK